MMQIAEIIADMLDHAPPRYVIVHGDIYDMMQRNPRCRCAQVTHTATVEAKGKRARRRAKGKARKLTNDNSRMTGNRAHSVIVDDPDQPTTQAARDAARALFEDRGPIGHKGRHSFPKSHRAEGINFVD